jgi:DHA2 family multidrug resistance protein
MTADADRNRDDLVEDVAVEPTVISAASDFKAVPHRAILTTCMMMAVIMTSLDTTVANVALPHMQGELSGTQDEMGWVLTSYIVATAIMIPLGGWLANEFGRRKVFLISIVVFTVASALCGLAQSLPQIVLFRFLQGAGGAALVPLAQAVLFDINPPKDFGRAMTIFVAGSNLAPIMGPILGGWLTEDYNWRWVFYINLPIGILAFFGLFFTLPDGRKAKSSQFDFFGFGMLSLAIASFQLMLDRGQLLDWFSSSEIIIEAAVAGLSLYLFLVHSFSSPKPFVNFALFKDRNFVAATVFIFLVGVVLFATLALLPPMLQEQLNYPVILTGLVTAPRGFGMIAALIFVGSLTKRFGSRAVMALGLAVTAYASWQMTQFSPLMGYWPVIISGISQGAGIGLVYVPLTTVAFTTLPGTLRNDGTAFFNLLRNLGSSIGISVVMFLLTQNTQRLHSSLVSDVTPYNSRANPALAAAHVDVTTLKGLAGLDAMITNQAVMIAYIDDFWLIMVMTLATIPFLLLIKDAKPAAGAHVAAFE